MSKPQPKSQSANKKITQEIDASGKVLGRLATQIATILQGKDKTNYRPNLVVADDIVVVNASKIVLTGKKLEQKVYHHHTGYLGHLKTVSAKELMKKNPAEVLEKAVFGMLPKNKLRSKLMKKMVVKN